jgi:hypothetical protein
VKAKRASIVLSGETPGKDELKFLHQQPYCLLFLIFIFPSHWLKILSINVVVLVENGIWVITKVFFV